MILEALFGFVVRLYVFGQDDMGFDDLPAFFIRGADGCCPAFGRRFCNRAAIAVGFC